MGWRDRPRVHTWGRVRAGSKSCRKHKACQPTATAGHATYLPKVFPMMPASLSQTGPEVFPPSTGRLIGGQTTQDEKMTKRKKKRRFKQIHCWNQRMAPQDIIDMKIPIWSKL